MKCILSTLAYALERFNRRMNGGKRQKQGGNHLILSSNRHIFCIVMNSNYVYIQK